MRIVATAHDVWPPGRLTGARDVVSQRLADVVAGQEDEPRLMARRHDAEPTGLEIKGGRVGNARQWVHGDHYRALESLPALWGVDADFVGQRAERRGQRCVHHAVTAREADIAGDDRTLGPISAQSDLSAQKLLHHVPGRERDLVVNLNGRSVIRRGDREGERPSGTE